MPKIGTILNHPLQKLDSLHISNSHSLLARLSIINHTSTIIPDYTVDSDLLLPPGDNYLSVVPSLLQRIEVKSSTRTNRAGSLRVKETSLGKLTVDVVDNGLGIEERPVDFEVDGNIEGMGKIDEIPELIECSKVLVNNAWILNADIFYALYNR